MSGKEKIIESKIGPDWFNVNILALFRWICRKKSKTEILLERFKQLCRDHELQAVQLLQLLPPDIKATAADLLDDEKVPAILTNDMLSWLAGTFGVRRAWLEGQDEQVYDRVFAYKVLDKFFGDLDKRGLLGVDLQPFLLHEEGCPLADRRNAHQMPVLVLVQTVAELGDRTIRRFIICGDSWNYAHPPCRIHLKTISRIFYKAFHSNTFLFPVTRKRLQAVRRGEVIPAWLPEDVGHLDTFEEFALSAEESHIAQETEELPMVLDLIGENAFVKRLLEQV